MSSVGSSGAASPTSPGPGGGLSMTSRNWVVPPRPKPGRKPATDTPPTKRKAQNRAAQRAFRERRAARVGELEEHIQEQRDGHETRERDMKERMHALEMELQLFKTRCALLQAHLEREQQERARVTAELDSVRRGNSLDLAGSRRTSGMSATSSYDKNSSNNNSNNNGGRRTSSNAFSIAQIISPPDTTGAGSPLPTTAAASFAHAQSASTCGSCTPDGPCRCVDDALVASAVMADAAGCGKCSFGTPCECLEATLRAAGPPPAVQELPSSLKRPHSPPATAARSSTTGSLAEKRVKADEARSSDAYAEVDFTAAYASVRVRATVGISTAEAASHLLAPREPCGFCGQGTYCVCADQQQLRTPPEQVYAPTPLPSIVEAVALSFAPPEPMEITSTGAIKIRRREPRQEISTPTPVPTAGVSTTAPVLLPTTTPPTATTTTTSRCGPGGPGTCAQCRTDSRSGEFCRFLAANLGRAVAASSSSSSAAPAAGCCGGSSGGAGGCCRNQPVSNPNPTPPAAAALVMEPAASAGGPSGTSTAAGNLSCAAAFRTIAAHPNFPRAAQHMGAWVPQLRAAPATITTTTAMVPLLPAPATTTTTATTRGQGRGQGGRERRGTVIGATASTAAANGAAADERHPIEVDAASVLSLMKDFDVRF